MLRYLPGIFLIQLISIVLVSLQTIQLSALDLRTMLQLLVPLTVVGVTSALWFDHIGRARAQRHVEKLKAHHAKDRENLQKQTEKEKDRVRAEAQKAIRRETRRVNTRANLKAFVSLGIAGGAGLLLLFTELFTLGMMTLMTASGAMGGYLWRASKENPTRLSATRHDQQSDGTMGQTHDKQAQPLIVGEGSTRDGSAVVIEDQRADPR